MSPFNACPKWIVRIQHPADLPARQGHIQCIQRLMLASARSKTVAEAQKVLFKDAFQYPDQRLLDNLVLKRGHTERPLSTVSLGYPDTPRRFGVVATCMNATVQLLQILLQVGTIAFPSLAIHTRRRLAVQRQIGRMQPFLADMMQQVIEAQRGVPSRCLAQPEQSRSCLPFALRRSHSGLLSLPLSQNPSLHRLRHLQGLLRQCCSPVSSLLWSCPTPRSQG